MCTCTGVRRSQAELLSPLTPDNSALACYQGIWEARRAYDDDVNAKQQQLTPQAGCHALHAMLGRHIRAKERHSKPVHMNPT